MLADDRETGSDGAESETCRRRASAETVEGIDGGEEQAGQRHVRCDDIAVGEKQGLEDVEEESEEGGKRAEGFLGGEEEQDAEGEGEEHDHGAAAHEDGLPVGATGVKELGAEGAVVAFEERDVAGGRLFEAYGKQRKGDEHFYQRGMFGVSGKVAMFEVHQPGAEVIGLVEGLGRLEAGADEERGLNGKEEGSEERGATGAKGNTRRAYKLGLGHNRLS